MVVAGVIFFELFIASPLWRAMPSSPTARKSFQSSSVKILWLSLALSITSAILWLCLLSMQIGRKNFGEVITDGTASLVLSQTQFGFAWQIRLSLGGLLAACLWLRRVSSGRSTTALATFAGLLSAAYLGSLAFAGHGTEGLGFARDIHLAADFLHLVAAGLWLGALVPLVLLLVHLGRAREGDWIAAAAWVASRFSASGIVAVGLLLVSGTINAAFLLGGIQDLTNSAYGRMLLLKVLLAAAMVCLAGFNRQYLLPRLSGGAEGASANVRTLVRSALIEIALGLAILCIVGVLGIMPPANAIAAHMP